MGGLADGSGIGVYQVVWWLHAAIAFSLIVSLAWTGFSHVFIVPLSVATHDPERPRTRLTTPFNLIEAVECEEDVDLVAGTTTTQAIAPPERLSADACVACGRCHAECPATAAGRPLSPRDLVQDIQSSLGTNLGTSATALPAAAFEDAVWSCTNCYACEQACPARIRHVDFVLDFRRALVDENRLDEQKTAVLQALDRNSNPYRLPSHERAAWLMELPYAEEIIFGVATLAEPPEYLYWIGCGAAYDERSSLAVRATMDLLRAADVSFLTLGPAEPCCGEPAKRLGEEGRFQMLAATAIAMIKETGASRIVTHCPHGLNTFLHEYPALGFSIPAVHHSQLLAELVAAGRLHVGPAEGGSVTYHEPCNLARAGLPSGPALEVIGGASGAAAALRGADVLLRRRWGQQLLPGRARGEAHQRRPLRGARGHGRRRDRRRLPSLPHDAARRGRGARRRRCCGSRRGREAPRPPPRALGRVSRDHPLRHAVPTLW